MFYEPSKGHGLAHDPFKALVSPRPIGWISTLSRDGAVNLSPYSFFNALTGNPPLVWFSSEGPKDSATYAAETGEFVANLVGRKLAAQMNASSVNAPRGVNEFEYAGLEAAASTLVKPPRVAAAPAALECKVTEIFRPRSLDGTELESIVVIGQVVGIHIADEYLKDGMFQTAKAGNVSRLGYMDFATVDSVFQMTRPVWDK